MKIKLLELLNLIDETEKPEFVIERIKKDSVFKGTNIWILVFAIFIASLGLNINSTAVIIGAMLISPLMGPIIAIGLGVAINDLELVKKAVKNFSFAIMVSLITSTFYFMITPLNDAYSELLARTTPTIYDVLIAMFGGLAGIVANASNQKGNVIPGVAIATALMPPLCTAGYGLATFKFDFFIGAFYLFTINTVFIALATFITLKFLNYPKKHLKDPVADKRSNKIILAITFITIIPSIYFGYEMINQNRFIRNANKFIEANSSVNGAYLLNKEIDSQNKTIKLIYGGNEIEKTGLDLIKRQLKAFNLENADLQVQQGFSFLANKAEDNKINNLSKLLESKEKLLAKQNKYIDSLAASNETASIVFSEMNVLFPEVSFLSLNPNGISLDSSGMKKNNIVILGSKNRSAITGNKKLIAWLKTRLKNPDLVVYPINYQWKY